MAFDGTIAVRLADTLSALKFKDQYLQWRAGILIAVGLLFGAVWTVDFIFGASVSRPATVCIGIAISAFFLAAWYVWRSHAFAGFDRPTLFLACHSFNADYSHWAEVRTHIEQLLEGTPIEVRVVPFSIAKHEKWRERLLQSTPRAVVVWTQSSPAVGDGSSSRVVFHPTTGSFKPHFANEESEQRFYRVIEALGACSQRAAEPTSVVEELHLTGEAIVRMPLIGAMILCLREGQYDDAIACGMRLMELLDNVGEVAEEARYQTQHTLIQIYATVASIAVVDMGSDERLGKGLEAVKRILEYEPEATSPLAWKARLEVLLGDLDGARDSMRIRRAIVDRDNLDDGSQVIGEAFLHLVAGNLHLGAKQLREICDPKKVSLDWPDLCNFIDEYRQKFGPVWGSCVSAMYYKTAGFESDAVKFAEDARVSLRSVRYGHALVDAMNWILDGRPEDRRDRESGRGQKGTRGSRKKYKRRKG